METTALVYKIFDYIKYMHHFSTVLKMYFFHFAVGLMEEEKKTTFLIMQVVTILHSTSLDLSLCEQYDTTDRQ